MRHLSLCGLVALILASASPVHAGAGLPLVASVQAGAYQIRIYNDSPGLRTGSNRVTVEAPGLPAGSTVSLRLLGPAAQAITIPVKPLRVVVETGDNHGETDADSAHDKGSAPAHGSAPAPAHGSAPAPAHGSAPAADSHGESHGTGLDMSAFLARGSVRLPAAGTWAAHVTVNLPDGDPVSAIIPIEVTPGGPHSGFITISGLLMGGSITVGFLQRRRDARQGGGA